MEVVNPYGYVVNNPINYIDPYGLFIELRDVSDFFAGFGDTISFGATQWARKQLGCDDVVNKCSGAYTAGEWAGYAHGLLTAGGLAYKAFGKGVRNYLGRKFAPKGATSKILNRTTKQLQKKFKHAKQFGVKGNYSKANAAKFSEAIHKHINNPAVKAIKGAYHKKSVTHYLDPKSGLNIIVDSAGNFISGWKLSPAQLLNVLKHGGL